MGLGNTAVLDVGQDDADAATEVADWAPRRAATVAPFPPTRPATIPSRYGEAQRPRWATLTLIILGHALLLTLLVRLDVIQVVKAKKEPLVVELLPEDVAPPPPPEPATQPTPPVHSPLVSPPPIVATPAPAPPIVTAPEPTPPSPPAPSAEVAAPAAPVAAPVTPPDGMASSLRNPSPRYPVDARRRRQSGTVRLRVLITEDGRVKEIRVARSSGVDSLDEAALDTVRRWKFRPGMQAGVAVEAVGYLNIPFELKG